MVEEDDGEGDERDGDRDQLEEQERQKEVIKSYLKQKYGGEKWREEAHQELSEDEADM